MRLRVPIAFLTKSSGALWQKPPLLCADRERGEGDGPTIRASGGGGRDSHGGRHVCQESERVTRALTRATVQ